MRNFLILMGCVLALLGACADNKDNEGTLTSDDPIGGADAGNQSGGSPGGDAQTGASGAASSGAGSTAGPTTGGSSAGTSGGQNGVSTIDPKDPPVPAEACGTELDAKNGRIIPDFNAPKNGGAFTGDPIDMGALKVVLEDKTLKNPKSSRNDFNVTSYAPSSDGSAVGAGPFPLIVVLPGFGTAHTAYRHFTDHFVSHGFAVLGITCANVSVIDTADNPANVEEIQTAIKWALEESQLKGKIDVTRMAVSGHSQGGKLAFMLAVTDPRFKVVLGWDPQNGGGPPCFLGAGCNKWPVAPSCDADRSFKDAGMMANIRGETLVFAARDGTTTPDAHLRAEHFYRGAPSPAGLLLFPAAGHGDWGAAGATTDVTKRVQLALLLTRFMGKTGLDNYLPNGSYAAGEKTVMVYTK